MAMLCCAFDALPKYIIAVITAATQVFIQEQTTENSAVVLEKRRKPHAFTHLVGVLPGLRAINSLSPLTSA